MTAISEETYKAIGKPKLQTPDRILYGPAKQALDVLGQFTTTVSHNKYSSQENVFVVRGLKMNLLRLPAITSLRLISTTFALQSAGNIPSQFPKAFTGFGTMGDEYVIKLKEGAVPYALYTPRNVAFPLKSKVKEELLRMERLGVISEITEPTPWCAGMVVVPKTSWACRICVDLKPLNTIVMREAHPIPKVEETLQKPKYSANWMQTVGFGKFH